MPEESAMQSKSRNPYEYWRLYDHTVLNKQQYKRG